MPRSNKRRRHLQRISLKSSESTKKRKFLAELVAEAREAVRREEEQCTPSAPSAPSLDRLRAVQAKCEALEEQYTTSDVFRRSLTDELWQSLVGHARSVEDDDYDGYDENNEDDDEDDEDSEEEEEEESTHENASVMNSSNQSLSSDPADLDGVKKDIVSGQSFLQWKETSQSSFKTITRHGGSVRDVARKKAEARKLLSAAARNGSKMTDFFSCPSKLSTQSKLAAIRRQRKLPLWNAARDVLNFIEKEGLVFQRTNNVYRTYTVDHIFRSTSLSTKNKDWKQRM